MNSNNRAKFTKIALVICFLAVTITLSIGHISARNNAQDVTPEPSATFTISPPTDTVAPTVQPAATDTPIPPANTPEVPTNLPTQPPTATITPVPPTVVPTNTLLPNVTTAPTVVPTTALAGATNTSVPVTVTPSNAPKHRPSSTRSALTCSTIRVEAGNPAPYTDNSGNLWLPDTGAVGGGIADRGNIPIANTTDARMYQTEHYGMSAYNFAVANCTYTVVLHFAETYFNSAGQRKFNVAIEGSNALTNFDVFTDANGARIADTKSFTTTVTNKVLNITFTAVVNNAEINGIEIIPSGAPPTSTPNATSSPAVPPSVTTAPTVPTVVPTTAPASATNTAVPPTAMPSNAPTVALTSTPSAPTCNTIRVDVGNPAPYTDNSGNLWFPDTGAVGGGTADRGNIPIANTTDARIYQTEHYGMSAYNFAVTNCTYTVVLHFAETYFNSAGQRKFNVAIEGSNVLTNFDVFTDANGARIADTKSFTTTVSDNALNITFTAVVNNAEINGIEIIPGGASLTSTPNATSSPAVPPTATTTPTVTPVVPTTAPASATNTAVPPTAMPSNAPTIALTSTPSAPTCNTIRVEAGNPAPYTDNSGNLWFPDTGAVGGGTADRGNIPIANTTDARIYQTEHYGMSAYNFAVANCTYTVVLHFAETYFNSAGQRVFNVAIEGSNVLTNFDLFADANGAMIADTKSFTTTVSDNALNITFTAVVNNAEINGIEIIPGGTSPTMVASNTPTPQPSATVVVPTMVPSLMPTSLPSLTPTSLPSATVVAPTIVPSATPTSLPSSTPTSTTTSTPQPSATNVMPTITPSATPTSLPSFTPTPQPSATKQPADGVASSGPYHVFGSSIYDVNDVKHRFHGVDRSGLEVGCSDGTMSVQDFANMRAWNANVVRIALNQDYWLSGAARYCPSYPANIDAALHNAVSAGIDVIFDLHWSDAGNLGNPSPGQQLMADQNSLIFWQQVASRYANDPHVLFELYNEPHDVSWDCWLNGCTTSAGWQAVGMQQMYDTIRSTGANNIVIAGGLGWAYNLSGVPSHRINGTNIAYATHPYDFAGKQPADWDSAWGFLTASDPVLVTEFGNFTCSADYYNSLISYTEAHNQTGWTSWAWTASGCGFPSILASKDGVPSDPVGTTIQKALMAMPSN